MTDKENNLQYLLALLCESGLNTRHGRKALTMQVSKGFKTKPIDLDETELVVLLSILEKNLGKTQSNADFERGDSERSRMVKLSLIYGFTKRDRKAGSVILDSAKLDAWLLQFGFIKKKLIQYTFRELPLLITQFETVVKNHLKTL